MPVNFNILQPQPVSQNTTITVPGSGQSTQDQLGQLGQGIMSGILQGQQIMGNNQQLQLGQMQLDKAKREATDANTLRTAAEQGYDQYVSAQMKIDPEAAMRAQKARQDFNNSVLQGESTAEDIKGKKLDYAMKINNGLGHFYGNLELAPQDQREKLYQAQKPVIEKSLPGVVLPDHYDQATSLGVITQSTINGTYFSNNPQVAGAVGQPDENRSQFLADNNKPSTPTDLQKAQEYVDNLKTQRDKRVEQGLDTTDIDKKIEQANRDVEGTIKTPTAEPKGPAIQQLNDYIKQLEQARADALARGEDTTAIDADIERAKNSAPGKPGLFESLKQGAGKVAAKILSGVGDKVINPTGVPGTIINKPVTTPPKNGTSKVVRGVTYTYKDGAWYK